MDAESEKQRLPELQRVKANGKPLAVAASGHESLTQAALLPRMSSCSLGRSRVSRKSLEFHLVISFAKTSSLSERSSREGKVSQKRAHTQSDPVQILGWDASKEQQGQEAEAGIAASSLKTLPPPHQKSAMTPRHAHIHRETQNPHPPTHPPPRLMRQTDRPLINPAQLYFL